MKTIKYLLAVLVLYCALPNMLLAQGRGGKGHKPHAKVVVVKKHHHKKGMVYHPYWGPKRNFYHRWVYFPKYNLYWDNYQQVYVYRNGAVWVNNVAPPPIVVNVNLENEKQYELGEQEDELDDVYKGNETHQKEYPKE